MADISFDESAAKGWITEVEGELELVNRLLAEVAQECATQPYEDDTIMMGMVQSGKALGEAWGGVVSIFQTGVDGFKKITNEIIHGVGKTLEGIGNFLSGVQY